MCCDLQPCPAPPQPGARSSLPIRVIPVGPPLPGEYSTTRSRVSSGKAEIIAGPRKRRGHEQRDCPGGWRRRSGLGFFGGGRHGIKRSALVNTRWEVGSEVKAQAWFNGSRGPTTSPAASSPHRVARPDRPIAAESSFVTLGRRYAVDLLRRSAGSVGSLRAGQLVHQSEREPVRRARGFSYQSAATAAVMQTSWMGARDQFLVFGNNQKAGA